VTQEKVDCLRNDLFVERELMMREDYRMFLKDIFEK
jgi:tRNA(His) guanylyltransferase